MMENTTETPKKKTNLYILLIVAGVLLLAGVAYVAGSLINRQQPQVEGMNSFEITDAEELPQAAPEMRGLVESLDGNSLFVKEFSAGDSMGVTTNSVVLASGGQAPPQSEDGEEGEGGPRLSVKFPETSGVAVEVVVTHDTQIYKDVTMDIFINDVRGSSGEPQEEQQIEQQVEEGSLEEIVANSNVTIWGERTGDRIVASVVLYNNLAAAAAAPVQAEP